MSRTRFALATLFAGTFVMGSAELVVVGILDLVAGDLSVSVGRTGLLVTAYALGISIGGPLLTALTLRLPRRTVLLAALGLYVPATAAAALSHSLGVLLALRAGAGALQGLFIGVAFAVGTGLVPRERMGRAIAAVIGGVATSTALGVPVGTVVAHTWGWRTAFLGIAAAGLAALVAAALAVPAVPGVAGGGASGQARYAFAPRVLAVLGTGFVLLGGQFAVLTYLSPFLAGVTGLPAGLISAFLFAYGLASAAGTFAGGRAADRAAPLVLIGGTGLVVVAIAALALAGGSPVVVAPALALLGLAGFGLVPVLQYRVTELAGPGRDLASSLPASALTGGIAVGAAAGGWAVTAHGTTGPVWLGLVAVLAAVPLTWVTRRLAAPSLDTEPAPAVSCSQIE